MVKIMDIIKKRAKEDVKKIVLPEALDIRVLTAAAEAQAEGIAKVVLLGDVDRIEEMAAEHGLDITGIELINPVKSERYNEYVNGLYELRKEKGMTIEKATELVKDEIYFGVLMVKFGHADGLVCGAIHSTADTLRPALQIVKTRPGAKCVSSCVLLEVPDSRYEKEYIFADCGLIQKPTVEELSEIAIASNDTYKQLIGETPKLAMLSYSTYGSAKAEEIDAVTSALKLVKEKRKDIIIDGELQLDAALDKNVAKLKAPTSKVAGEANVLIFPNLEAGNIGYKLVERLGNGTAYGPITQGLAKPINDLSRGCKAKDVVGAIAITAVQASAK